MYTIKPGDWFKLTDKIKKRVILAPDDDAEFAKVIRIANTQFAIPILRFTYFSSTLDRWLVRHVALVRYNMIHPITDPEIVALCELGYNP